MISIHYYKQWAYRNVTIIIKTNPTWRSLCRELPHRVYFTFDSTLSLFVARGNVRRRRNEIHKSVRKFLNLIIFSLVTDVSFILLLQLNIQTRGGVRTLTDIQLIDLNKIPEKKQNKSVNMCVFQSRQHVFWFWIE